MSACRRCGAELAKRVLGQRGRPLEFCNDPACRLEARREYQRAYYARRLRSFAPKRRARKSAAETVRDPEPAS